MSRVLTALIWMAVTLAFAFDAVAEPCASRHGHEPAHDAASAQEMPCHGEMTGMSQGGAPAAPEPASEPCCCLANLSQVLILNPPDVSDLRAKRQAWNAPLTDPLTGILIDFEPPPPRA